MINSTTLITHVSVSLYAVRRILICIHIDAACKAAREGSIQPLRVLQRINTPVAAAVVMVTAAPQYAPPDASAAAQHGAIVAASARAPDGAEVAGPVPRHVVL